MSFAADRRAALGATLPLHTCPAGHFKVTESCPVCLYPKPKKKPAAPRAAESLPKEKKELAKMVAQKLNEQARDQVGRRGRAARKEARALPLARPTARGPAGVPV